jgi:hypothetical protein
MKVLAGILPTENKKPAILLGLENSNGVTLHVELTPNEARVFGLQLKVLADSIERMSAPEVTP